ncbi:Formyltransferase/hydrolase complex Fhc subunit A [Planctomycetes bacterium Pan216]|uniref:Formyltransferase/hydrolase complex Fhc subunit A n=1 Tax=Kolteria novifilia TaxID=2527975 RepID=A0A518B2K1_9BACT|nr:Formyltransferase/hydrolase complex Fhc subunit A [Planctomycetes bacterium Pan216]
MTLLKLRGGTVVDPANGIAGEEKDLWIEDARIVAAPSDPDVLPTRTIDLRGYVVMPGGVDMHSHIAGPKLNAGRRMCPEIVREGDPVARVEERRSGLGGTVPTSYATGYLYAGLGYTSAVDAAVPPLYAREVHEEFDDTPVVDKAFLALCGNNHYLMERIKEEDQERTVGYLAWLLTAIKGYGLKIVNPGGVEQWKRPGRKTVTDLDSLVAGFGVTPRAILRELARAADTLTLPHSVHVHTCNLGIPGNWETTRETMRAFEGHRAHLAHVQFHGYGGGADDEFSFTSAVPKLVDELMKHPNLSIDVGNIHFGRTMAMTGDGPVGHYLHRVTGGRWYSSDSECETGCGVLPIEYRDKNLVHAIQWAAGLEWYLLVSDPWRLALSTDHPNGAAFTTYPHTIELLMSRDRRREVFKTLPKGIARRCLLADLDREYTLEEIAIITRASPAKLLGLTRKGHLGPGADADVTVYLPQEDKRAMFESPRYVFKSGCLVVEDGEVRADHHSATFHVNLPEAPDVTDDIRSWFSSAYTIQFDNYAVADADVPGAVPVAAGKGDAAPSSSTSPSE